MSVLVFNGVGVASAQGRRAVGVRALKGRRRKAVIKLRDALRVVGTQDQREAARADIVGYVPYLFGGAQSTDLYESMFLLLDRCDAALTEVLN